MELAQAYHPLTACPALAEEYPPCAELRPYVRCFWRSRGQSLRVIPDTCMDLLFEIGEETAAARFCGLDDSAYHSAGGAGEIFGIRFYAWSAHRFADDGLGETFRGGFSGEQHFQRLCRLLLPGLARQGMRQRVESAQRALLACLRRKENTLLTDAVGTLLIHRAALPTAALAGELHISTRQLEREFRAAMGLGPKKLAELMRYQMLWQEMLLDPWFQVQDAVEKYGFSDQAHLQNSFRRHHGLTPRQAVICARESCRNFTIQTFEAVLE